MRRRVRRSTSGHAHRVLEAGWKNLGEGGAFFHEVMGSRFDWNGIVTTPPTTVFDETMEVTVGGKRLVLTHLGSAHTRGDVLVHVPADRILYTGDLLFVGGHPVLWAGPIENWIKACDYILESRRRGHRARPWADRRESRPCAS